MKFSLIDNYKTDLKGHEIIKFIATLRWLYEALL